jgi:hypothetical protein
MSVSFVARPGLPSTTSRRTLIVRRTPPLCWLNRTGRISKVNDAARPCLMVLTLGTVLADLAARAQRTPPREVSYAAALERTKPSSRTPCPPPPARLRALRLAESVCREDGGDDQDSERPSQCEQGRPRL